MRGWVARTFIDIATKPWFSERGSGAEKRSYEPAFFCTNVRRSGVVPGREACELELGAFGAWENPTPALKPASTPRTCAGGARRNPPPAQVRDAGDGFMLPDRARRTGWSLWEDDVAKVNRSIWFCFGKKWGP